MTANALADRARPCESRARELCSDSEAAADVDKDDWIPRKQAYLDHLRALPPDHGALLVSASDKLHNARAIVEDLRSDPDFLDHFRTSTPELQRWYYTELAAIFATATPGPLADELHRTVSELCRLSLAGGGTSDDG